MTLKEFQVVARRKVGGSEGASPQIYKMRVFAENDVHAKSRFWYFLAFLVRMKKSEGEILAVNLINEKKPSVLKNFGIWLRYNSRSGTHNMYKEFRALSRSEAVNALYMEMAARHRARNHSIHVINTAIVKNKDVVRPSIKQFLDSKIRFPMAHNVPRATSRTMRTTFKASRPRTAGF